MKIRKAEKKDIPRILALLGQVLQIHAEIRPDIFIPGTTKYTPCELTELLQQEDHPIYVAVDENDLVMHSANSGSSPFPRIWSPLNPCLSMIFALTSRHGVSISGKACLNM